MRSPFAWLAMFGLVLAVGSTIRDGRDLVHQRSESVGCAAPAAIPVVAGAVGDVGACILKAILVDGASSAGAVLAACVGATIADVVAIASTLLAAYTGGDAGLPAQALPPASPDLIARLRRIAAGT